MNSVERRQYYKSALDWDALWVFLTDNGQYDIMHIEFGFRGKGWLARNIFFNNLDALKAYCIRTNPLSVELGMTSPRPPFPAHPLEVRTYVKKRKQAFILRKPLVFDWDIDHKIRTKWGKCKCGERELCNMCWKAFGEPARVTLERALTYWLGYKNIMCIFSGRRGFHMWVLDSHSRTLSEEQRTSILHKITHPVMGEDMYNDLYSILEPHYNEYHKGAPYQVMDILYELDTLVTTQIGHLTGLPWFPNANNGVLRLPITKDFKVK